MELKWLKNKNNIQMVANGLIDLQEDLNKQVYHRDLKANNILLDENMNVNISNFGLAKFLSPNDIMTSKKTMDET